MEIRFLENCFDGDVAGVYESTGLTENIDCLWLFCKGVRISITTYAMMG